MVSLPCFLENDHCYYKIETSFYSGCIKHTVTYEDLIAMYCESQIHASIACLDVFLFVFLKNEWICIL